MKKWRMSEEVSTLRIISALSVSATNENNEECGNRADE